MSRSIVQKSNNLRLRRHSGKRVAIAVVSWCLAGVSVWFSVVFAGAFLASGDFGSREAPVLIPLFAWVALAVMSVRWVQAQRCYWLWPVLGTLSGVTSAVLFATAFFFYISAVPLAIYLVFWHLKRNRGAESAA